MPSSLKNRDNVTILYKPTTDAPPDSTRILAECFPKDVATAFSTVCRDAFPPLNQVKIGEIQAKSITFTGGYFQVYKDILTWMLASCDGKGLAPVPTRPMRTFTYLYWIRACAEALGCVYLVTEADMKMSRITEGQLHTEDVRALWFMPTADDEMRKFLIEHLAVRFWERRLRTSGAYWALRGEIPDLDQGINSWIANKKVERAEERQKLLDARKKERDTRQGLGNGKYRGKNQGRLYEPRTNASNHGADGVNSEAGSKTTTLKLEVVRKGNGKKPAYAKLDLGAIGVTRDQFCGRRK